MDALVTVRMRIGVDALTESPLMAKPEELQEFIYKSVKTAFDTVVQPGNGIETAILGAKAENITILSEGAPIGNRAGALLQHSGAVVMDHVADLNGVMCIPIWNINSDQLPRQWMFIRRSNTDPLLVKMQAAESMSRILREQAAMYTDMINEIHRELQTSGIQLAETKRELAGLASIAASNQAPAPGPMESHTP